VGLGEKKPFVINKIVQIRPLNCFLRAALVETYLNVIWLLHVFCMWQPHAKDMQIAMNFQQKFGAFRSSFNTCISEYTEG
jgi:hypothetical protein